VYTTSFSNSKHLQIIIIIIIIIIKAQVHESQHN